MSKRECQFCKCYKRQLEYAENQRNNERWQTRFYAAFVTKDYDKDFKHEIGTINFGTVRLHYCPYCGKKLR